MSRGGANRRRRWDQDRLENPRVISWIVFVWIAYVVWKFGIFDAAFAYLACGSAYALGKNRVAIARPLPERANRKDVR